MKKLLTQISFLFIAVMIISSIPVFSQEQEEITEGTEFWFGIPLCMRDKNEAVRWGIYPIELWVSSKVDTKIRITSADGNMNQNYALKAKEMRIISISDDLENEESEVITQKGIFIKAEDPITVGVFTAYKWSGEAYRVTPVEWLGKEYYTLNLFQDYLMMASGYKEYKPAQFLIIATEDNTIVKITPKVDTQGGIKAGTTKQIKMNKGETYLVLAKVYETLNQDWKTDLTGSHIVSSAPIAVISGHTKGAFARYPPTMYGIKTDFIRNMLSEMMWPVELLGCEYITAPLKYRDRKTFGLIEDDRGDLIRFVATRNNTEIYQMRQDGSSMKKIGPTLQAGEVYDILNCEEVGYYKSNYPVMVGQYGKAWISNLPNPVVQPKDDEVQNPSRNGQGMLLTIAPIERWCEYASFRAVPAMDGSVYITLKTKDVSKIKFDGVPLSTMFGASALKPIPGTEYSYILEEVASGDHWIEGDDNATFAAYCYGNWDSSKDGFAYGYPVGINYASKCEDSTYITETIVCGDVTGKAFAVDLQKDTSCAALFNVIFKGSQSQNYTYTPDPNFNSGEKECGFTLTVMDKTQYAKAVVYAQTRSGKTTTKTYEYYPEQFKSNPTTVDFGLLKVDEESCKKITISNPGQSDLVIKDIRLRDNAPEFNLKIQGVIGLPLTLTPGQSQEIEVCAKPITISKVIDYVEFELSCATFVDTLKVSSGEPIVWIGDANWGAIPINTEKSKVVDIENQGIIPVTLTEITWDDKTHFTRVENLTLPLTLEAGSKTQFTVYYIADVPGVQHTDTAWFKGNTDKVKLYSAWNGSGIEAGPVIEGYNWSKKRVIDEYQISQSINNYEGTVEISSIGNTTLEVTGIVFLDNPDNVFSIKQSDVPTSLEPGTPVTVKVYFAPSAEKVYKGEIQLVTRFNGETKTANAYLEGIGIQPHINVEGYNYGKAILVGASKDGNGLIEHVTLTAGHAMELQIFDIDVEGTDKNAFVISQQFLDEHPTPFVIQIGGSLDVPIKFTGLHSGTHTAELVVKSDAPSAEKHRGDLIGLAYTEGLKASDWDFGTLFITTSGKGRVWLLNEGSETIQITRDITASVFGNANHFNIDSWSTAKGGLVKPNTPFDLGPGDSLYVDVTFTPTEVTNYSAYIEYETTSGTQMSNLKGAGMVFKMVVRIPKGYKANPGQKVTIDYMVDKHSDESKQIEQANIKSFKAVVKFVPDGQSKEYYDIYPEVEQGCVDIIKTGTMTDGWTCEYAHVIDNQLLVYLKSDKPLKGSGTLFKFVVNTFLSDLTVIPLPPDFVIQDNSQNYVIVEKVDGDISVNPVCVDTLRMIKPSVVGYSLAQNTPNPVENTSIIQYSVGIQAQTVITLYNSFSEKVAVLVNEYQAPGVYEYTLNVESLGLNSGAYYYRIESGPFTDTKPLIITK